MPDLLDATQRAAYKAAITDVFLTFSRPFQIYLKAQTAVISTSMTFSRFGQHDQNAAINAQNTALTPVVHTVNGCVLYKNNQPWDIFATSSDQQLKLRDSDGVIRIKVMSDGYGLLKQAKMVTIDGFDFQLNSTPRPHGIVGAPDRWTFQLQRSE